MKEMGSFATRVTGISVRRTKLGAKAAKQAQTFNPDTSCDLLGSIRSESENKNPAAPSEFCLSFDWSFGVFNGCLTPKLCDLYSVTTRRSFCFSHALLLLELRLLLLM